MHIFKKALLLSVLIFTLIYACWQMSQPINLVNSDIGRHITNGKIIFENLNNLSEIKNILQTNYYSTNYNQLPFINHHWLSGLLYFGIYSYFGFLGLSIFNLLLIISIILFLYKINQKYGKYISIFSIIIAIPLITNRVEIRPEIMSLFLGAILLYIILNKKVNFKSWWLILFFALWTNLHIYFFWGLFTIGLWALIESIRIKNIKNFLPFIYALIGSCLNPFAVKILTYPLTMTANFNYSLAENKSLYFLSNLNLISDNLNFLIPLIFIILLTLIICAYIFKYYKDNLFIILLAIINFIVGIKIYRHLPFAGLSIASLIALGLNNLKSQIATTNSLKIVLSLGLSLFALISITKSYNPQTKLGLLNNNLSAINFIIDNKLTGLMFNNYDIGSYLIFGLFPNISPYVDNRPEAYSKDFFDNHYIEPMNNPASWQALDDKNNFNLIVFGWRDLTSWGQNFIKTILNNDQWKPIYLDNQIIILIKNLNKNKAIIDKYQIDTNIFNFN